MNGRESERGRPSGEERESGGFSAPEFWAGKTVLVTGGTGFVGRNLTQRLRALRAKEIVSVGHRDVNLVSTTETLQWAKTLGRTPQIIFHLAAWAKPAPFSVSHPAELFEINTVMHANMLRAWHQYFPTARFMGCGTTDEYPGHILHMSEEDLWNGEPHSSVRMYAMTKRLLYAGQCAYAQQYRLSTVHVIFPTLYGPGDYFDDGRSRVVSALIHRFVQAKANKSNRVMVWGDGYQTRECLFIDDAIDGLLLVVEKYQDVLINIGTGVGHTIRDLAETIAELCDYDGEIDYDVTKFVGMRHKVLNIDKARFSLGWNPPTSLREGLRRTIDWYRENVLPHQEERASLKTGPRRVSAVG